MKLLNETNVSNGVLFTKVLFCSRLTDLSSEEFHSLDSIFLVWSADCFFKQIPQEKNILLKDGDIVTFGCRGGNNINVSGRTAEDLSEFRYMVNN